MTQSKKIAIQLGTYDGTTFTPDAEYETPKVYDVWNMTSDWNVEWLKASARQRALEGRDRAGVGGFRYEARVTFRTMLPAQAKAIRDLLNDIFEDPMFPRVVKISEDEDISNGEICNFRGGAYGIRRELTIGRQAVNMEFANLFRLNRVTDDVLFTGEFMTTTDDQADFTDDAIFEYFDKEGTLLFTRQNEVPDRYAYMEWLSPNAIVVGGSSPARYKITLDRSAGTSTLTLLETGESGGAVTDIDLDEQGYIYSTHASGANSIVKIDQDGNVIASSGNAYDHIVVGGEHVYTNRSGVQGKMYKHNRNTLQLVGETSSTFRTSVLDTFVVFDDIIVYCHAVTHGDNALRIISKTTLNITKTVSYTDIGRGFFLRVEYDENGIIYVLTPQWILKFDKDLNLISEHDLGVSGAGEMAIVTPPVSEIYVRYIDDNPAKVRIYDRDNLAFKAERDTTGRALPQYRNMNAYPGRAAIKFKVLGLTKQF